MSLHVTSDELVDLLEGGSTERAAAHLETCEACRRQLAGLRAMMSRAAEVEVPEPSPLFWDHLSARVRERIAAQDAPRSHWKVPAPARWTLLPVAGALAVAVLLAVSVARRPAPPAPAVEGAGAQAPGAGVERPALQSLDAPDDPLLALVADLTGEIGWEGAIEAGLGTDVGGLDGAIGTLTENERRELQRLLTEALGRKPDA